MVKKYEVFHTALTPRCQSWPFTKKLREVRMRFKQIISQGLVWQLLTYV
jgi:hypothetical protein